MSFMPFASLSRDFRRRFAYDHSHLTINFCLLFVLLDYTYQATSFRFYLYCIEGSLCSLGSFFPFISFLEKCMEEDLNCPA